MPFFAPSNSKTDFFAFRPVNRAHSSDILLSGLRGGSAFANGTMFAAPFFSGNGFRFDALVAEVTGNNAGGNFQIGLYNDTGAVFPKSLIIASGLLSSAAVGIQTVPVSALSIASGELLWLAFVGNGLGSHRANTGTSMPSFIGADLTAANLSNQTVGFSTTGIVPGSMPATFPAAPITVLTATSSIPYVGLRFVSP